MGKDDKKRQEIYKSLFDQEIPDYTLREIRDAINKAWVLGDDRFKKQIEKQAGRRASPMVRGGDRESERYKADQLLPFDVNLFADLSHQKTSDLE